MSGWLDSLMGRIRDAGVDLALGYGLNFGTGLRAVLNPSTRFIDVSVREASLTPALVAAEASGSGVPFVVRIPMTAGAAGTADDVEGDPVPCDLRIVDRFADITTAIGSSTLRVRTAAGGVGSSLSGIVDSGTVGDGIRADTGLASTSSEMDAGDIPYVRRQDRGVAGAVYLLCVRK